MPHTHDHTAGYNIDSVNRALTVGIILNIVFVIAEAAAGLWQDSLALLADAGHNLSDVASLALALAAFKLAQARPSKYFTYGYRKTTILVALLNAMILLLAIGVIGYEAVKRIAHPEPMEGGVIAIVAGIGILINGYTAWLFLKDKDKDLNIKGAYLHMAADALVSLGVVVAGLVIMKTGWYWIDPVISFVIMAVILFSTWGLLRESLRLSMDAVPKDIHLEEVKKVALQINGILDIHHIHIWAMSTTQNALTAHLVVSSEMNVSQTEFLKEEFRKKLTEMQINHSTLEIESQDEECGRKECVQDVPAHGHLHTTHTHTHTL